MISFGTPLILRRPQPSCPDPRRTQEQGTSIFPCRRIDDGDASVVEKMLLHGNGTCGWKADLLGCRKSAGTPDARKSRLSMPSPLKWQRHQTSQNRNFRNSTSVFLDPKSVSRRLQSPQTSGTVPSNSRGALQHGTSAPFSRRPLNGDASTCMDKVLLHVDCTWVGGDLGNCRNVETGDTSTREHHGTHKTFKTQNKGHVTKTPIGKQNSA